jgi:hypothetical protein
MKKARANSLLELVYEIVEEPEIGSPDGMRTLYIVRNPGTGEVYGEGYTPQTAIQSIEWRFSHPVPIEESTNQ